MPIPQEKFDEANKLVVQIYENDLPLKDLFYSQGYYNTLISLIKKYTNDEEKIKDFVQLSDIIITGGEQPRSIEDLAEIFKNYLILTGDLPIRLAKDYWQEILLEIFDKMIDFWKNRNHYLEEIAKLENLNKQPVEEVEEQEEIKESEEVEEQEEIKESEETPMVINLKETAKQSKQAEVEFGFKEANVPEIDWEKIKQEVKKTSSEIEIKEEETHKDLSNI